MLDPRVLEWCVQHGPWQPTVSKWSYETSPSVGAYYGGRGEERMEREEGAPLVPKIAAYLLDVIGRGLVYALAIAMFIGVEPEGLGGKRKA